MLNDRPGPRTNVTGKVIEADISRLLLAVLWFVDEVYLYIVWEHCAVLLL